MMIRLILETWKLKMPFMRYWPVRAPEAVEEMPEAKRPSPQKMEEAAGRKSFK